MLFLVVAMEKRVCLVARSRVPEVNVGEVMRSFQGGGHPSAASATVHGQPLKQVLEKLEELLRVAVRPRISAGDIMSAPVKTMPVGITIAEARELLTRYNCNAMPVMDGPRMVGIISRKTVEKALYHELAGSLVSEFMHTEFLRATPETPAVRDPGLHGGRQPPLRTGLYGGCAGRRVNAHRPAALYVRWPQGTARVDLRCGKPRVATPARLHHRADR